MKSSHEVDVIALLERVDQLCRYVLPKFNWGASALDARSITLLNEVPGEVSKALQSLKYIKARQEHRKIIDID